LGSSEHDFEALARVESQVSCHTFFAVMTFKVHGLNWKALFLNLNCTARENVGELFFRILREQPIVIVENSAGPRAAVLWQRHGNLPCHVRDYQHGP
jgi:hypothetical protein